MINLNTGPLANRTISGFPLSIGTGLAMESLFSPRQAVYDESRKVPEMIDVRSYKRCYINLATLFRNIWGAVDRKELTKLGYLELTAALSMEIEVINSLFQNEGFGACTPYYYFPSYDKLYRHPRHNALQMRRDNTDNQKYYTLLMMKSLNEFFKYTEGDEHFEKIDSEIRPNHSVESLIITHSAYDLLSHKNFRRLDLLESHTGILKPKHLWYTKFHKLNEADLSLIPFNRQFLSIFGDSVLFSPLDVRFRRMLLEIAKNRKWTQFTTDAKILLDLQLDIKEPYLLEMYRAL